MRLLPAALAVALLSAGAACSGTGTQSQGTDASPRPARSTHVVVTPEPPEPGVHLTVVQQRHDEGSRVASLRVANVTARPLRVRRVGLDWPGWGRFTVPSRQRVAVGQTLDLPMRLPAPRCGAVARAGTAGVATGVAVTREGVLRRRVDAMGMRFARRLWESACAQRRLDRSLAMAYGAPWRERGSGADAVLRTSLVLRRRHGSAPVRLTAVQGSVLFDLRTAGRRRLAPAERVGRLPLAVDPGRCDEHARGQASQPFTFRLHLRLGTGPVLPTVLEPTARQRRELLGFLDRACRGAG